MTGLSKMSAVLAEEEEEEGTGALRRVPGDGGALVFSFYF